MANSNLKYNGTDLDTLLIPKSAVWQPGEICYIWQSLGENSETSMTKRYTVSFPPKSIAISGDTNMWYNAIVKNDGTLWTWGYNTYGQLGHNDTNVYSTPTQVGTLTNWKQVSGVSGAFCAVKTDGTLWTWGSNSYGNLGLGNTTNRSSPTQVGTLTNWKQVAAGGTWHGVFCAVKTDGTLWTWGNNTYGALGLNDTTNRNSPVQVGTLTDWSSVYGCNGQQSSHFFAIKTDGTLWTTGKNIGYVLGINSIYGTQYATSSPVQVGSLTNWKFIATAPDASFGIKTDGTLWSWGLSGWILGHNDTNSYSVPVQVGTLTNWSKVDTASYYSRTAAIKTDGTLWTWGVGSQYGGLGQGNANNISSPTQVGTLNNWVDVGISERQLLAIQST